MDTMIQPTLNSDYSEAVDELATSLELALDYVKNQSTDKDIIIEASEDALKLVEEVDNNFYNRMVQEKKELDAKINKLRSFLFDQKGFDGLSRVEQISLSQQYQAMEMYSKALGDRLARCL